MERFKIGCFGRLPEVRREYSTKGRHVYLEGGSQTRKWKGPEGEGRITIEVVASQVQILDRAPKNGDRAKEAVLSKPAQAVNESENPFNE